MDEKNAEKSVIIEDGYIKLPVSLLEMFERETVSPPSPTLNDWYDKWLNFYKKNQIKAGTLESYRQLKSSFIEDGIGRKRLSEITSDDVQELYNSLYDRGYATISIRILASILGTVLGQAVKTGLIQSSPADNTILPKSREGKKRVVLTQEQQRIFMEYAEKSPLLPLYQVMLRTGLRNGEIRALRWEDIDFENGIIHVRRTMRCLVGNGKFEDEPKTKTSKRDIPLSSFLRKLFADIKPAGSSGSEFVFLSKGGKPISREILSYDLKKIKHSIHSDYPDFPDFTPHSLRHTFATRAIEGGMSPQVLKTILGHKSLSMTMDLYCHVMPETKKDEMERISSEF